MTAMPAACTGCARTLRDSRARKSPDAVSYAGHGMCVTCRKRSLREASRPTECDSCGQGLHYRGGPKAEGTVEHVARGLCRTCYDAERNIAKTGEMYPDISAEQHRHTMAGWLAWREERRRRGVPADGFQVEDEPDTVTQILAARPGKTPSQRRAIARLVEQLENERAGVARDTRAQEARHRNQYGIVA